MLMDGDAMSRAPLESVVDYDEHKEWKTFSFATVVVPETPVIWGYGIGCDIMATANTPL